MINHCNLCKKEIKLEKCTKTKLGEFDIALHNSCAIRFINGMDIAFNCIDTVNTQTELLAILSSRIDDLEDKVNKMKNKHK